jgi:hypothetical protein
MTYSEIPTAFVGFSIKASLAVKKGFIVSDCIRKQDGKRVQLCYKSDGENIVFCELIKFSANCVFEELLVTDFIERYSITQELKQITDIAKRFQWDYFSSEGYSDAKYRTNCNSAHFRNCTAHIKSLFDA